MTEPSRYDLNAGRALPRVVEIDVRVLPEPWRGICERNRIRPHAVLGYENEAGSIKIWPAGNIIARGIERGEHLKANAFVESSSGNFVEGLAQVLRQILERDPSFPVKRVVAVVSKSLQPGKVAALRKNDLIAIEFAEDAADAMRTVERLAGEDGYWYTRQYWNADNPASYRPVGEEIARRLPDLGMLACGVGSGGTFLGVVPVVRAAFESRMAQERMHATAVAVAPGDSVGGVRTEIGLQLNGKPGLPWRPQADDVTYVDLATALRVSAALWQQYPDDPERRIVAGESSGFALAGALLAALQLEATGRLEQLRNPAGEIVLAFIAPDTREPYREEYEKHGIIVPSSIHSSFVEKLRATY